MQAMSTVNMTRFKMTKSVIKYFGITAAALVATLSSSGADRPARAAVEHAIEVKQVSGYAEYAYDSTGWKPLTSGKVLHAGAFVRTGSDGKVILAMEEPGSLVRVGPLSRLELAKAAPATERGVTMRPLQASASTAPASEKIIPVIHKGSYSLALQ
jgi:hypothetical protein